MRIEETISGLDLCLRGQCLPSNLNEESLLRSLASNLLPGGVGKEDGGKELAAQAGCELLSSGDPSLLPVLTLLDDLGASSEDCMEHIDGALVVSSFKRDFGRQKAEAYVNGGDVDIKRLFKKDLKPVLTLYGEEDYPAVFSRLCEGRMRSPLEAPARVSWQDSQESGGGRQDDRCILFGLDPLRVVLSPNLRSSPVLHCCAWAAALRWVQGSAVAATLLAPVLQPLVDVCLRHCDGVGRGTGARVSPGGPLGAMPWPSCKPFTSPALLSTVVTKPNLFAVVSAASSALREAFSLQESGSLTAYARLKRSHMVLLLHTSGLWMHGAISLAVLPFVVGGTSDSDVGKTVAYANASIAQQAFFVVRRALHDGGVHIDGFDGSCGDSVVDDKSYEYFSRIFRDLAAALDEAVSSSGSILALDNDGGDGSTDGGGDGSNGRRHPDGFWGGVWLPLWDEMERVDGALVYLQLLVARIAIGGGDQARQAAQLGVLCRILTTTLQERGDPASTSALCTVLLSYTTDLAHRALANTSFVRLLGELCPYSRPGPDTTSLTISTFSAVLSTCLADEMSPVRSLYLRLGASLQS